MKKHSFEIPDVEVEWAELEKHWAGQEEDDFIKLVNDGMTGVNQGFDNGSKNVSKYTHGTHRGRYILIGADSGVGKTTLADFMYLYALWKDCRQKGIKLYIKYFSFELSRTEKIARWVCQWIYHISKKSFSSDYIAGRIPGNLLTEEDKKLVLRGYAVVRDMLEDIQIYDHLLHPTGMLNKLIEDHYEQIGTVVRDAPKEGKKKGSIRKYIPNDSEAFTLCVVDHLALINIESGCASPKQCMDRWSMYCVQLRNLFKCTIVNIQQFSTGMISAYRDRAKAAGIISPQRLDFGDSTYTYRDADLVMGLIKPVEFDLKTYDGYSMEQIGQYFLALFIMKHRYGAANHMIPLFINPVAGMFWDLPLDPLDSAMAFYAQESARLDQIITEFKTE